MHYFAVCLQNHEWNLFLFHDHHRLLLFLLLLSSRIRLKACCIPLQLCVSHVPPERNRSSVTQCSDEARGEGSVMMCASVCARAQCKCGLVTNPAQTSQIRSLYGLLSVAIAMVEQSN